MRKQYQAVTAAEAVKVIKSGDHVHISSVSNVPQCLVKALCDRGRAGELKNVYIHHLHTEGAAPYVNPEFEGIFQHNAFFVGANVRESVQKGLADYIPVFLGETSKLYRERYIKCNVAMIQVCPPDKFGYVSLGSSVDATLAAMESAEFVIAVVNKHVPRTFGDALVHISRINVFVEDDAPLLTVDMPEPNQVEKTIGRYCAELIEDGACLQMGIGSIPNAILSCLHNHKDIGIHTEMFSDGILPLVKKGVITGDNKKLDKGKIVSTFVMGSKKIYDFIDGNHEVLLKDVEYTNDPFIIAQQPKMTSINSAIQIDLSGQVCADSLGDKIYSGVGGQIDYVYGSSRAKGGKSGACIVPIAFPLIAGPGALTALLSLRADYAVVNIIIGLLLNILLDYIVISQLGRIQKLLGENLIFILRKFFGVILLAIAVNMFVNNITVIISQVQRIH